MVCKSIKNDENQYGNIILTLLPQLMIVDCTAVKYFHPFPPSYFLPDTLCKASRRGLSYRRTGIMRTK